MKYAEEVVGPTGLDKNIKILNKFLLFIALRSFSQNHKQFFEKHFFEKD